MSSLRERAIAKLRSLGTEAGHGPGQDAGQPLSHLPDFPQGSWDSKNGGNLPQKTECPAVPSPREWDSGTAGPNPGQEAGQQAGQAGQIDPRIAAARLREWRGQLSALDPCKPLHGIPMGRWQDLCDDTVFVVGNFGERAAFDGWSTADLFGLWPGKPHWGGIVDRLRGARSLVMTANRAHWRSFEVVERFNRGSYPDLRPFWELPA